MTPARSNSWTQKLHKIYYRTLQESGSRPGRGVGNGAGPMDALHALAAQRTPKPLRCLGRPTAEEHIRLRPSWPSRHQPRQTPARSDRLPARFRRNGQALLAGRWPTFADLSIRGLCIPRCLPRQLRAQRPIIAQPYFRFLASLRQLPLTSDNPGSTFRSSADDAKSYRLSDFAATSDNVWRVRANGVFRGRVFLSRATPVRRLVARTAFLTSDLGHPISRSA